VGQRPEDVSLGEDAHEGAGLKHEDRPRPAADIAWTASVRLAEGSTVTSSVLMISRTVVNAPPPG
jgi:hypothetical protein